MRFLLALAFAGCAYGSAVRRYTPPGEGNATAVAAGGLQDFRCFDAPADPPRGIRHWGNRHLWTVTDSQHRGTDLIASDAEPEQVLGGKLAHWVLDKAIEDEDVTLYACERSGWRLVGTARTDDDGRFALRLRGDKRLAIGMRDIYAAAPDGDDFRFLAYVAPVGTQIVVSDIDGTLTHSEGAFPKSVLFGSAVQAQPNAAASLRAAAEAGYQLVYLTARGERFTDATRRWLVEQGFPRGPLRLGRPMFVRPGEPVVEYKWNAIVALRQRFTVAAGIGNRASDVEAYRLAGLPARRTFIKLPEFSRELEGALDAHRAIGFQSYGPLPLPPRTVSSAP
jgi:phosphatidate phosphatase PAH1